MTFQLNLETVEYISADSFLTRYPQRGRIVSLPGWDTFCYIITDCLCIGTPYQNVFPIMPGGNLPYILTDIYPDAILDGLVEPSIRQSMDFPFRELAAATPLCALWSSVNLAHWTFQSLPFFLAFEEQRFTGAYIVSDKPYCRGTLDFLGAEPSRVLRNNAVSVIHELWLPVAGPIRAMIGKHKVLTNIRKSICDAVGILPDSKRLYIKRSSHSRRKIVNDDALERMLKEYGFITCIPEEHSIAEQFHLMTNAESVVLAHGAAAALLIAKAKGGSIIEVFNPFYKEDCFAPIASFLEAQYADFTGAAIPDVTDPHSDFVVDCAKLEQLVQETLGE
ncbi:glycosyltransferase family 61 protein [Desulfovibrio sp. OttesenSCG-928-M14]|nr:glycosyltransferase family 61 protein [Desulfovibrio sp. OttesenSCG-928-M14]